MNEKQEKRSLLKTPAWKAIWRMTAAILKWLKKKFGRYNNGQTAIKLAKDDGDKELMKILEIPQKVEELFQDKAKPTSPMTVFGGGRSVEADKSLLSVQVYADQQTIKKQNLITVSGGKVAIGPESQVVNEQYATTSSLPLQFPFPLRSEESLMEKAIASLPHPFPAVAPEVTQKPGEELCNSLYPFFQVVTTQPPPSGESL
ncbi:uncharacterized protein LOC144630850 [Oculina patagonica]